MLWGPFASSIDESIGETVGIARGETFAIGIQALNIRTLGGYPWNENDAMPQKDLFEDGDITISMQPSHGMCFTVLKPPSQTRWGARFKLTREIGLRTE